MKESKIKKIIFCQGDKKELEEITGEEYEYIKLEDIQEELDEAVSEGEYSITFIYDYDCETSAGPITHEIMMYRLREKALAVSADAIVHYSSAIFENSIDYRGYARGTPVRKKN